MIIQAIDCAFAICELDELSKGIENTYDAHLGEFAVMFQHSYLFKRKIAHSPGVQFGYHVIHIPADTFRNIPPSGCPFHGAPKLIANVDTLRFQNFQNPGLESKRHKESRFSLRVGFQGEFREFRIGKTVFLE